MVIDPLPFFINRYKETAPLAFANTFMDPLEEYKSWHLTAI
jgi:hypothetical protein